VMVSHHNSAEAIIKYLNPEMQKTFKKQQLINCEIIKLNPIQLPFKVSESQKQSPTELRLFPLGFYNSYVKKKIAVNQIKTYPYYIFYLFRLNLFLTILDIVKQKNYGSSSNKNINANQDAQTFEVKNPLIEYLNLPVEYYLRRLHELNLILKKYNEFYTSDNLYFNYKYLSSILSREINQFNYKLNLVKKQMPNEHNYKERMQYKLNIENFKQTYTDTIQQYLIGSLKNSRINIPKQIHNFLFAFCNPNLIITQETSKVKPLMGKLIQKPNLQK